MELGLVSVFEADVLGISVGEIQMDLNLIKLVWDGSSESFLGKMAGSWIPAGWTLEIFKIPGHLLPPGEGGFVEIESRHPKVWNPTSRDLVCYDFLVTGSWFSLSFRS